MNKNTTKRSLLASVMALVLCVIMLVGTTFAWFTDTASTSVNRIQAGKLDVALEMMDASGNWVNAEGQTLSFKKAANAPADEKILWEPGCTYELPELRIVNNGNLALKYKIVITGIGGDVGLNKVIDWTMALDNAVTDLGSDHSLAVGANNEFTISGHMQETAGNEYQGLSIDGISITVYATQDNVESDSYGPNYDKDAEYAVATAAVTVDADNKVVGNVTLKSVEKTADGNPVAMATVPAGAAVNEGVNKLTLTIVETDKPANFEVAATQGHTTLEVKMEGLAANNTEPVKVEMIVEKDLTSFQLFHNGVAMTKVDSAAAVENDQEYYYDSATGVVTMRTAKFSPFTYTYDKGNWSDHAAVSYATPVDTDNKVVTIASAEELALFAKEVNSGKSYAGYTVKLTQDIDLGRYMWTPIGTSANKFSGKFDGQNYTISNLLINGLYDVGLFGFTTNGEVKNLTVKNAMVKGYLDVGVVAGTPYTSKYTNITVCGDVTVDGYAYVGGVFGKNVYANLTDITVEVNPGSYVKADSTSSWRSYVGGVVGFMGEGNLVVKNVKSNIDVIGSTCDVGGITGIAHYGNTFVNCSSSGNVTLQNAIKENRYQEIGGIAGVWHNQDKTTVTFTDCSYTGILSTCYNGIDKTNELNDNYKITGRMYSSSGTGTLIIDGQTVTNH